MSDHTVHTHRPRSRIRQVAHQLAGKPETTLWVAVCVTVMVVAELGDHLFGWW